MSWLLLRGYVVRIVELGLVLPTCKVRVRGEEAGEEVQELVPLLALLLEREDRDEYGEHFEVEHKEEEVLRGTLLPSDLEVAVLEPLEVEAGEPGEEVEAELHGLDFLDDQLDYLQRVALLVDLLDDEGLLDQDGVDELDQLVLEREAFLPELQLSGLAGLPSLPPAPKDIERVVSRSRAPRASPGLPRSSSRSDPAALRHRTKVHVLSTHTKSAQRVTTHCVARLLPAKPLGRRRDVCAEQASADEATSEGG